VPTPEAAEAVTRLIAARARLTEITKKLNETHSGKDLGSEARQRYDALEKEWETALKGSRRQSANSPLRSNGRSLQIKALP